MDRIETRIDIITDIDLTQEETLQIVTSVENIMKQNPNRKYYHISGFFVDRFGEFDSYCVIKTPKDKKIDNNLDTQE